MYRKRLFSPQSGDGPTTNNQCVFIHIQNNKLWKMTYSSHDYKMKCPNYDRESHNYEIKGKK